MTALQRAERAVIRGAVRFVNTCWGGNMVAAEKALFNAVDRMKALRKKRRTKR